MFGVDVSAIEEGPDAKPWCSFCGRIGAYPSPISEENNERESRRRMKKERLNSRLRIGAHSHKLKLKYSDADLIKPSGLPLAEFF